MPTVRRWGPYRAFFYLNEGGEPPPYSRSRRRFRSQILAARLLDGGQRGIPRSRNRRYYSAKANGMSTLEIDVGDIRPVAVAFTPDEFMMTLADGAKSRRRYPGIRA